MSLSDTSKAGELSNTYRFLLSSSCEFGTEIGAIRAIELWWFGVGWSGVVGGGSGTLGQEISNAFGFLWENRDSSVCFCDRQCDSFERHNWNEESLILILNRLGISLIVL